jgi:hypothetical protein
MRSLLKSLFAIIVKRIFLPPEFIGLRLYVIRLLSYFEKIEYVYGITLLSVCVCVCVSPLSLLGNGSVKVPLSLLSNGSVRIPPDSCVYYEITLISMCLSVWPHNCLVFYAVRVILKGRKRLVLPRTSCIYIPNTKHKWSCCRSLFFSTILRGVRR